MYFVILNFETKIFNNNIGGKMHKILKLLATKCANKILSNKILKIGCIWNEKQK